MCEYMSMHPGIVRPINVCMSMLAFTNTHNQTHRLSWHFSRLCPDQS